VSPSEASNCRSAKSCATGSDSDVATYLRGGGRT
jgi:hypothetical protein